MTATSGLNASELAELARYDTPTVCNVIELFELRRRNSGYMNDTIRACFPHLNPMVGYALTSFFRSMSPPREGDVYASLTKQLEKFGDLPGPAVIVFQDLDVPIASATFGEVMCTTYQAFGARGLITSGTGRDLDQVERLAFPCFTSGTTCARLFAHPRHRCSRRGGRNHSVYGRIDPRRPQRRDDHPARNRFGGGGSLPRFCGGRRHRLELRQRPEHHNGWIRRGPQGLRRRD